MKIYAFIFTLSLFSIISNGVTQDPPKAFAPQAPSAPGGNCGYTKRDLVKNEGSNIQTYEVASVEQCKSNCKANSRCNSFTYCTAIIGQKGDDCHLKTRIIDQYSATKKCNGFCTCKSYYPTSCQRKETCKAQGEYCGAAGNGNDYGNCCNNMECAYSTTAVGGAGTCTIKRASCKAEGQYCGAAGNGNDYGNCCNNMDCTFSDRKIGGAGTCTNYPIDPPCADDPFWTDYEHGDGKAKCEDLTRKYCNEPYKGNVAYVTEARRACPFSCQLC